MFDNQIDISSQNVKVQPQNQPAIIQQNNNAPHEQFTPPPEILQQIDEFRSKQNFLQQSMTQTYIELKNKQITQDQFELVKNDMQSQQKVMMDQMQEFQIKNASILQQMSQMNQRQAQNQQQNIDISPDNGGGHSHNGRKCNHDHGNQQQQHRQPEKQGGGHSHNGRQCNHDHGKEGGLQRQWNPFANYPSEMRVFVLNQILGGEFFLQMFLQLPMMMQGYQMLNMAKGYITFPIFWLNSQINMRLEKFDVSLIRSILGGLGVYYLLFHYFIYTFFLRDRLINLVDSESMMNLIKYDLYLMIVFALLTVLVDPGDLTRDSHKIQFQQLGDRLELQIAKKRANCPLCDIPKVMRSQHCMYSKKCIARYENHSMILNRGLGAYNYPFYILFMMTITNYFLLVIYSYTMTVQQKYPKSILDLFAIIVNIHQLHYFTQQSLTTMLRISYNITQNEISNWRRFQYFWKNERGEFFNPFDKGFFKNWYAFYLPIINKLFCQKYVSSASGVVDWGQAKFLNVTDLKGHPMAARISEEINKQIQRQQEYERKVEYQQEEKFIPEKSEEKQGLLSDINL